MPFGVFASGNQLLRGGGPPAGLVFEDEGIEQGPGGRFLVLVELGEGLELEPDTLIGAALALDEDLGVGGAPEGAGGVVSVALPAIR